MKVGDIVKVLPGATAWMKENCCWLEEYPVSIDNLYGKIERDYTDLPSDDSHFSVILLNLDSDIEIGINPKFLKVV